jgi:CBS domain-containing protein/sporulation protein YlmC with PRC-barrel domain
MYYISELIGKTVTDVDGRKIGSIKDLLAAHYEKMPYPKIVALDIAQRRRSTLVAMSDVAVLIAPAIPLKKRLEDIKPYQPKPDEIYLVRDVLDKQIIDTNGVRVVRVNDLELTRVEDSIYIANVDVGSLGLLRRLGLSGITRKLAKRYPSGMISWGDVELIAGDQPIRLKVPGEKITELHPADLAEILSDLSRPDGSKLLEKLDVKTLAETLEEVEPDFQASLIEQMSNERVADVLEEMAPDEAADLLAELPEDRSAELLKLMEDEDAEDVRKLLRYEEDTAGGLMNTEFISVPAEMTSDQVIQVLRKNAEEAETMYYIYVTDKEGHLVGVFSLRDLVLAQPGTPVSEFMEKRVVTVNLKDSQEDCAQVISKYNLIAVPVVDDEKRIQGIVAADDALDHIIPTAWKKRLPRFYH